jgi:hypothetical protein
MGEIPAAGSWLRLEVPAKSVGLENKKLYGISFMLFGGQCKWHRAGAVDPAALLEPDFDMESTVGMVRELAESTSSSSLADGPTRWNGSLLLSHNAFYRVHFQNQLGYANKPMQEARLTAIPDNPPQVALEKPGADIVLSQPQRVTLVVHASDDFGLSDVSWTAQKGDSGGFVGSPLIEYEDAVRSDTVVAALDLEPHQLKQGDFVRYRIQARDRKGQLAQTKEFVVRIQHDNNAADKQLASTAEQHETLRAKLEELVRRQTPIGESLADLAAREGGSTDRQGLSQLAAPQDANAQIGTQIRDQLQQASIQAANSNLVPDQIAAQMRLSEQLFQHDVLRPMHELVELMRQAADDQKPTPDVAAMSDSARRIQRQLETIQSRLQSLARAQQKMHDDPADAIDQLREELLTQNASLTGQELAELRDYLDRLAGRMKLLEGRENELAAQTRDAAPLLLPDVEKQQTQIESDAERLIAHAEAFMQSENARELTKESPQVDNHSEPTSGDPLGVLNERMGAKDRAKVETATQSGNEHGYTPTGVKKKLASRPASVPPNDRPKSGSLNGARNGLHDQPGQQAGAAESSSQNGALRAQLAQRQEQTSLRLHRSREQIEAPRDQIGLLIEQLSKALGANPGDDIGQLSRLMQSDNVRSAAQLAKAVRRLSPDEQPNVQSQQASPSGNAADTTGLLRNGVVSDFDDLDLDLATRAALLRMQPRVREELLKGMREAGPEPYRKLIEEYFNRLTKVKGPQ